jgi:hypothetical protein
VIMLAVHTCPLWEHQDGQRIIGINPCAHQLPVVGWCNAAHIAINGETRWFLLTLDATR